MSSSIGSSTVFTAFPTPNDEDDEDAISLDPVQDYVQADSVNPVMIVQQEIYSARIEGSSADGIQKAVREQVSFSKDNQAEIAKNMVAIEEHVKTAVGADTFKQLLYVYPMTGQAVWEDLNGVEHVIRLLTEEHRIPTCLEGLREVYRKTGDWKTESWPTYDVHTKGNGTGVRSLDRDTNRLQNAFKCSKQDLIKAIHKANSPPAKIALMADLYRAEKLKTSLVKMYRDKAQDWRQKATNQAGTPGAEDCLNVAKNLEEKANYFSGQTRGSFDWDAVQLALLNPIDCSAGLMNRDRIVDQSRTLKKELAEKIEGYKTDLPKHDFLSAALGAIPILGTVINIGVHAATDRTDHTLMPSENEMAVDLALLGIEHEDPRVQRVLTEYCGNAMDRSPQKMRKDPAEFLAIKLLGVVKRSGIQDLRGAITTQISENSLFDQELTRGLSAVVKAEIQAGVADIAGEIKGMETNLSSMGIPRNTTPEGYVQAFSAYAESYLGGAPAELPTD